MLLHLLPLLSLLTTISATALTYKLTPNEKTCFFSTVATPGTKAAFYFAVQAGGSFDIDYSVQAPSGKLVLQGAKERQGDFVFTANEAGEYRYCFDNDMSTVSDKMVDFEITVSSVSLVCLWLGEGGWGWWRRYMEVLEGQWTWVWVDTG